MTLNIIKTFRGGSTTIYSVDVIEKLALFDAVKKQTDKLINTIQNSVSVSFF